MPSRWSLRSCLRSGCQSCVITACFGRTRLPCIPTRGTCSTPTPRPHPPSMTLWEKYVVPVLVCWKSFFKNMNFTWNLPQYMDVMLCDSSSAVSPLTTEGNTYKTGVDQPGKGQLLAPLLRGHGQVLQRLVAVLSISICWFIVSWPPCPPCLVISVLKWILHF